MVRDDIAINGRILDEKGKPVDGAKVRVVCLKSHQQDAKSWDGPVPGQPAYVRTAADGRFRLTGLGRERMVYLALEGPAIQYRLLSAVTVLPTLTPKLWGRVAYGYNLPATFEFAAPASKPIRGTVRDKATNKPVAGVRISENDPDSVATTYTDKEGRYELLGVAKAPGYWVTAQPQNGQLYFAISKSFDAPPGQDTLVGDFHLVGKIEVRGRITDQATGKPPKQAMVEYHPLYPNASIDEILDKTDHTKYSQVHGSAAVAGPDGSYRLTVLPGPGVLGVIALPRESYARTAW